MEIKMDTALWIVVGLIVVVVIAYNVMQDPFKINPK
jgi:hypothetical protein